MIYQKIDSKVDSGRNMRDKDDLNLNILELIKLYNLKQKNGLKRKMIRIKHIRNGGMI